MHSFGDAAPVGRPAVLKRSTAVSDVSHFSARAPLRPVLLGIGTAAVFWFCLFWPLSTLTRQLHDQYFWFGMSIATTVLGIGALFAQRQSLRRLFHFEWSLLAVGIVHAVGLCALSWFGIWLMATFFGWVMPQIEAIYVIREQLDERLIAVLLIFIIAPFEEIFWRGLVLDRLLKVCSSKTALATTVALYCLIHIWALNPMLLIAALVLGAHWSYLYWRFGSLVPGIVSHALWDVTIFVIFPVQF